MMDRENNTGFSYYAPSPAIVDLYEYKDGTPFDWNDIIPGILTCLLSIVWFISCAILLLTDNWSVEQRSEKQLRIK